MRVRAKKHFFKSGSKQKPLDRVDAISKQKSIKSECDGE